MQEQAQELARVPVEGPVQAQELARVLAVVEVLVGAQVPVLELEEAPEQALAWELVLDLGQALDQVDLAQVAAKDRTAMALVMELVMPVLAQQTVQALAQATALVRADMDRAAASNANQLGPLRCSPHPPLSG